MAKFDVTVHQTPHVFSDSPGIHCVHVTIGTVHIKDMECLLSFAGFDEY